MGELNWLGPDTGPDGIPVQVKLRSADRVFEMHHALAEAFRAQKGDATGYAYVEKLETLGLYFFHMMQAATGKNLPEDYEVRMPEA